MLRGGRGGLTAIPAAPFRAKTMRLALGTGPSLSLLELGLSCHISILPMAPDGFRDGRGRMSTLPPVAFDDRSFKNHRPFDRRKPHGPAPQVLTHARCRSTTAPGGASGRRKMRTSSLSQANGRTGRGNGTSSQQDGVPIFGVSRFTGGALRCSWLRGWPWDLSRFQPAVTPRCRTAERRPRFGPPFLERDC